MLAQALFTHFGGEGVPGIVAGLLDADACARAIRWGLAMRLGQRLSGGVAGPLKASRLGLDGDRLTLALTADDTALYGEAVERRHKLLAEALGRRAALVRT